MANDIFLRSSCTTPVVHMLVCSTIFCHDCESAGQMSRLRSRTTNLRWSHCSWCQVQSVALSPMAAGTTLIEPWRTISHWVRDSGRTRKPQQSDHFPPLGLPTGPHSRVTPKVGHGMLAWLKAASSGEVLRSPSPDGVSRSTAILTSPVMVTAPSFMHRSRMSNMSAMHTDLRLAHSLSM